MSYKSDKLWENLKEKDFRDQFIDAHVDEGIAFQIRSLRNKKEQTQPEFAQELGVKQPLVSAWENPNYGKYSLNTLKKLAKAFDVGLLVRFVSFHTLMNWTIDLNPDDIAPLSFTAERNQLYIENQVNKILDDKNEGRNASAADSVQDVPKYQQPSTATL
ncbi:MAG TPA: helix-turn-helix transcriptional regulator [Dehalococcoidia bacterium]|nr:helix-turn-helix transcriptional regulator [Dehalococcoidia bacterium]